jgi:1-acyl-sn-glycerol-3-phosphate acyltransferase
LQRGAANIAIRGVLPITPVIIKCDPPTLSKGEKWYRIPSRRFHVSIEVREDLPVDSFVQGTTEAIASRRLTEFLSAYFAGECASASVGT